MARKNAPWDKSKGRPEPIAKLNRVHEHENGEEMVDLRTFCPRALYARPQVIPFLRKSVAEKLNHAITSLPDSYCLAVMDAWRPYERQVRIWEYMWNCAREAFPDRDYTSLRRTVCQFVAPVDQPAPPGHCTGAAVDVQIVTPENEPLDVVSPYTRFTAAATFSYGLSEEATHNRKLLVEAMLGAGFSNCRHEFWHYSYGDAGWAVREELKDCFFGLAKLEYSLYEHWELEHIESMKDRPNPWISG